MTAYAAIIPNNNEVFSIVAACEVIILNTRTATCIFQSIL
jgi:hypothetical protein